MKKLLAFLMISLFMAVISAPVVTANNPPGQEQTVICLQKDFLVLPGYTISIQNENPVPDFSFAYIIYNPTGVITNGVAHINNTKTNYCLNKMLYSFYGYSMAY